MIMGQNGNGHYTALYHNTGAGFEDASSLLPGLVQISDGSIAWGDYDKDGRPDLFINGTGTGGNFSILYHNTGTAFEVNTDFGYLNLAPLAVGAVNGRL